MTVRVKQYKLERLDRLVSFNWLLTLAAVETVKKFEEWGPGMHYTPREILISDSKDIGIAMGVGTYKDVEEMT